MPRRNLPKSRTRPRKRKKNSTKSAQQAAPSFPTSRGLVYSLPEEELVADWHSTHAALD